MNNSIWVGILTICCIAVPPVAGQEKDYAKPIVDKAVKALGDAKKQNKLKGITFNTEAKVSVLNNNIQFSGSWSVSGIDKFRGALNIQDNNRQNSVTVVINGKRGWAKDGQNGMVKPAPEKELPKALAFLTAVRLPQMPAALHAKGIKLSPLGEIPINGKTAVGLKVERAGQRDISIYFDKKSGLPLKSEVSVEDQPGIDSMFAFSFDGFKEIDGVKQFTKMTILRNQQQVAVVELNNIRLYENLDATTFAKPE